jgi:hypothetical protein
MQTATLKILSFCMKAIYLVLLTALLAGRTPAQMQSPQNLLLNGEFHFQSFDNSRDAKAVEYRSGSIPFWDQENYGDVEVVRAPRVDDFKPRFPVEGVAVLHPGKTLSQFSLLSEMKIGDGDTVSLSAFGFQKKPGSLQASVLQMRADSESGEWSPKDFGQNDARTFPKMARGELIPAAPQSVVSGTENDFEIKIENIKIVSNGKENPKDGAAINTVGLQIEFTNTSDADVWIYSPCLTRSTPALNRLPASRELPAYYRYLPRTISKLRRGEPLHIIAMGSSIDRASANPPLYRYDEDTKSKTYKQPISKPDFLFDGEEVGHPEWTPYIGQWRHFFSYTGRMRRELMRRWNYPSDKILMNYMACDGSSIGESHSALEAWSTLALPPDPETNGQSAGKSWTELYPAIFARPEGARPDLVIFGSGANEKIDGADEVAAFEGAIRWFQHRYPNIEFVFCMWQNRESYTPNTGMLKDLSLRYGIPFIDFGREFDLATRDVNSYSLTPRDGHPQAGAHYIWGQQLARAFQPVDPIAPGAPQQQLPERISPYTPGWEGEMQTYEAGSPRIYKDKAFVLDDTVVNLWAGSGQPTVGVLVDGQKHSGSRLKPMTKRDPRNSVFATGALSLGDRHILELTDADGKIAAVDSKIAFGREQIGVADARWKIAGKKIEKFDSAWGAPYGSQKVVLNPGETATLQFEGDAVSVAWLDDAGAGVLQATIDGAEKWKQPANQPFIFASGEKLFLENRKGIRDLAPGAHALAVTALEKPVTLLGAFVYQK